jgi:hypothetical protein
MHQQGAVALPEHLEHYLKDDVLISNWYTEADFRDLMLLVGRAMQPAVKGNVWRFLGKQGAVRDSSGVYASWLRKGDPERTLQLKRRCFDHTCRAKVRALARLPLRSIDTADNAAS